jgi:uncharacterized membrane protein
MRARATVQTRLVMVALGLVPVIFHVAIAEASNVRIALVPYFGVLFRLSFVTASACAHWTIYGGLLLTFALTLRPGREPLVTAITRRLHGTVCDELATYTRRVTMAWCGFFAVQLATSVALLLFAPLVVWSFFVNILDVPLVVAMFAAEYMIRLWCLQDPPRHSVSAILNIITEIRKTRNGAVSAL